VENDTSIRKYRIPTGIMGKESIIRITSHREREEGQGVRKEVRTGPGSEEQHRGERVKGNKWRTVGGRNIGASRASREHRNREEKGEKGNIITQGH